MTPQPSNTTILIDQARATRNVFPHLLVLIGGLLLFFDLWMTKIGGVVSILAGLFSMFARTGIELDAPKNWYRNYMALGNLRWGKWKPLSPINYVAIVRVRLTQLAFRPSEVTFRQSADKSTEAYNVNLIFKDVPNKVMKLYTGNLDQAFMVTRKVAKELSLHIYDCTTQDKKWIAPENL
ncbi:MAG: hypothetical protein QM786_15920 [Breznakibacter sp.]